MWPFDTHKPTSRPALAGGPSRTPEPEAAPLRLTPRQSGILLALIRNAKKRSDLAGALGNDLVELDEQISTHALAQ